jgi:tetratricopeptide (TPR) repeat protein
MWGAIAYVLWEEKRWCEAEELLLKVVETISSVLGHEHPETLYAMSNLATTYSGQGRLREAQALLKQVVKVSSEVLGKEHSDTISAIANLAWTYRKQMQWKKAEKLLLQVAESRLRVLGIPYYSILKLTLLRCTGWIGD